MVLDIYNDSDDEIKLSNYKDYFINIENHRNSKNYYYIQKIDDYDFLMFNKVAIAVFTEQGKQCISNRYYKLLDDNNINYIMIK